VVKNVGVLFDSELKFDKQIHSVVKSGFFNLRLLAKFHVWTTVTLSVQELARKPKPIYRQLKMHLGDC